MLLCGNRIPVSGVVARVLHVYLYGKQIKPQRIKQNERQTNVYRNCNINSSNLRINNDSIINATTTQIDAK
jgi:hypothetical protein